MPPLIYPEESDKEEDDPRESLSNPPFTDTTPEPGPPSEKPSEEPTSETDSDALSESSAPMREGSMGDLTPGYIVRYQKGSYTHRFSILEERTEEAP